MCSTLCGLGSPRVSHGLFYTGPTNYHITCTVRQNDEHRICRKCIVDYDFFVGLYTSSVQLYIAGLPLRSCCTIGAPPVQGAFPMSFSLVPVPQLEPGWDQSQQAVPTP